MENVQKLPDLHQAENSKLNIYDLIDHHLNIYLQDKKDLF
jgi:hypothetical protein